MMTIPRFDGHHLSSPFPPNFTSIRGKTIRAIKLDSKGERGSRHSSRLSTPFLPCIQTRAGNSLDVRRDSSVGVITY